MKRSELVQVIKSMDDNMPIWTATAILTKLESVGMVYNPKARITLLDDKITNIGKCVANYEPEDYDLK